MTYVPIQQAASQWLGGSKASSSSSPGYSSLQDAGNTWLTTNTGQVNAPKIVQTPQVGNPLVSAVESGFSNAGKTIQNVIQGIHFTFTQPTIQSPIPKADMISPAQTGMQKTQTPQVGKPLQAVENLFPQTAPLIENFVLDPLSLKANPTKAISDAWNSIKQPVLDYFQAKQATFTPPKSLAQDIGQQTKLLASEGNILFSPITALFSAANNVPVIGSLSKLLTIPFALTGEAASGDVGAIVDALPISKQAKAQIKPGLQAIGSLAGQMLLGHAVGGVVKDNLSAKFGETDANTIIQQAQEVAKTANRDLIDRVTKGKGSPEDLRQYNLLSQAGLLREVAQKPGIAGLLTSGEHTPQEIINNVFQSKAENTADGKAIIKAASEAQTQGKNIVITKADELNNLTVTHNGARTAAEVQEQGLRYARNPNTLTGKAVYFSDSPQTSDNHGENIQATINTKDYNLKIVPSLSEQQAYVQSMGAKDLSEAIQKEGKYDGFIIPNNNKDVGNTIGITNLDKLNANIIKQIQTDPQVQADPKLFDITNAMQQGAMQYPAEVKVVFNSNNFDEFTKHIQILSENHGGEFTEIYNAIKSGTIDSKSYESFKNNYQTHNNLQSSIDKVTGNSKTESDISKTTDSESRVSFENGFNKGTISGNQTGNANASNATHANNTTQPTNRADTKTTQSSTGNNQSLEAKGSQPIGSFEKIPVSQSEAENFKLHEEIKSLIDKYAQSIGEGHLPRNAAGVYFPETKNIRINGMNNLSVAAHEITHFLDYEYNISKNILGVSGKTKNGQPIYSKDSLELRKEITKLYKNYYGEGKNAPLEKRVVEGFATLLQKYIEMPSTISNEFPNLVKEFLQPEGKYYQPVIGNIIQDLRQIVSKYQGLDALDKIGTRVTSEKNVIEKQNFLSLKDRIRTVAVDNIYPLEVLAKRSGTSRTLDDASMWARFYPTHAAVFANNVTGNKGYYAYRDGQFIKVNKNNWASLIKGLNKEKQLDSFGYYLVARDQYFHWQELDKLEKEYAPFKPVIEFALKAHVNLREFDLLRPLLQEMGIGENGFKEFIDTALEKQKAYTDQKKYLENNGFTRKEIEDAYIQNKNRWPEEEKLFDELTSEGIKFANHPDVGLLSNEQFKTLENREGYASMKRQIYDELVGNQEGQSGVMKVGGTKISSLIQRKGGENTIINPLFNALTNEREILQKGLKQIIWNKMGKLAIDGKFPTLMQRVPLVTAKQNDGKITFPQDKENNIMMMRVNGKRVPILMDAGLKKAIDEILTHESAHIVFQALKGTSRFFTRGTTALYPQFALTNFIRHEIDAAAQSQNGFMPLVDPIKTLTKSLLLRDTPDAYRIAEYFNLGGMRQTLIGWQDASPDEIMRKIAGEQSGLEKVIEAVNKGIDVLAIPARYSEAFTRASEYVKSINKGNPQIVAFEDAGRVTAPFHHIGSLGGHTGQMFVKSIPFFNPELQYLDQAMRAATTPETRQRYLFIALLITASIIAGGQAIMRFGTKQQKQTYKDLQANDLGRYLWFPDPNGKDLLKLPMPPQMTPIANLVNMIIGQTVNNADYSATDFIQGGAVFLPNPLNVTDLGRLVSTWTPQILKPLLEYETGMTDYPTWHPMVSQTLSNLPPSQQYTKATSPVAKEIGKLLNLSPIKVDALITGYLGRASGFALFKPSNFNFAQGVTQQQYFDSGRTVQKFYDEKTANDQNYTALTKGTQTFSNEETAKILQNHSVDNSIGKLLNEYRKVDLKQQPDLAAQLQDEILTLITTRIK